MDAYQVDQPSATEQEFLDNRKIQLVPFIAHNYGAFDNFDGTGSIKLGSVEILQLDEDGNPTGVVISMLVDMRLFWFFVEHANYPDVPKKTEGWDPDDTDSRRLSAYQEWFLDELDHSKLLEKEDLNDVALMYLED